MCAQGVKSKPEHATNFVEFLRQENIPNDLPASVLLDLTKHSSNAAKELLKDKRLAMLVLEKM